MTVKLPLISIVAIFVTSQANAFLAENDLIVKATGAETFEVPYRGLSGPSDFWCAAGDYVIRDLKRPADTLIYRTSSPPRRAGRGNVFICNTLDVSHPVRRCPAWPHSVAFFLSSLPGRPASPNVSCASGLRWTA